jgi:hypothetical protein
LTNANSEATKNAFASTITKVIKRARAGVMSDTRIAQGRRRI